MRIEEIPLGKESKRQFARKSYDRWINRSKEAHIYKAVLFALSRGICPKCGVEMILSFRERDSRKPNVATLDHTVPLSVVVEHLKYGMEIMCFRCNQEKGAKH